MPRIVKKRKKKKSSLPNGFLLLIVISALVAGVVYYLNSFNSLDIRSRAAIEDSPYFAKSRGYFTTPQELNEIRKKSDQGVDPHAQNVRSMLTYAGDPDTWPFREVSGTVTCGASDFPFTSMRDGAYLAYAKAMAYHLTGEAKYAESVKSRLMDLTDTTGFGGEEYSGANQCILELAWIMPAWIQAADLIEEYPGWTRENKKELQYWLNSEIYKKVSWASRARSNNWGSGGSATAMMIADYLWDSRLTLVEISPESKKLSPAAAFLEHRQMGLDRMNNDWRGDSQCPLYGIQPYGGIPDELRRGSTGCTGTYILSQDKSHSYQITHLEGTVSQAEMLLRRGDDTMYTNSTSTGGGSLKNAILFVIANPNQSYDWTESKKSTLHMAQRFYQDAAIQYRLDNTNRYIKSGYMNVFGKLTHGYAPGETLTAVPVVPAPSDLDDVEPTATPTEIPSPTPEPTATPTPTQIPTVKPTEALLLPNDTKEGDGLWTNYFTDKNLSSYRFSRIEKSINYNWKKGSPDPRIDDDNFSVKWTGYLLSPTSGTYTFYVTADDGEVFRINGQNIIQHWSDGSARTQSATIDLKKGDKNPIRLEYYENRGNASVKLEWSGPGIRRQIIPQKYLYTYE